MSLGLWALCGFLATLVYKLYVEKMLLSSILHMKGIPPEEMPATGGLREEVVRFFEKLEIGGRFSYVAGLTAVVVLFFFWPVAAAFSVFSLLYTIVMPSRHG